MNIVPSSAHGHFDGRQNRPASSAALPIRADSVQRAAMEADERASPRHYPAANYIGQAYRPRFDSRVFEAIDAYQAQALAEERARLSGMLGIDVYA